MNRLVVLPCNGLDKEAGALARELSLHLLRKGAKLVCPVLYQRSPARYRKDFLEGELLVIDGCKTGCASKLARERGLRIARRLNVTELLKGMGIRGGKAPVPDPDNLSRLLSLAESLVALGEKAKEEEAGAPRFSSPVEMRQFMVGKFMFKVPVGGYFFNENDCWARVEGSRARLGVSDYLQQSAADMVFFEPPEMGAEIAQFEEAGSLESTKTALDIISPVSGRVVAINQQLVENPELVNLDPYIQGWAAELELTDFSNDRDLLMYCDEYYSYLKEKVEREFKERYG